MKTLGLTGGIGSGKSSAAQEFARLGAYTVSADEEAKRLMLEDPDLRAELTAAFGPATYDQEGRLDRRYLADQVFGDDQAIARLNAIVHPRVKAAFPEIHRRAEASGAPLLVYEAALLLEAGLDDRFDALATVDAPRETRIARVMERDGVPREAVEARMRHQLPADTLLERADYVIDNSGAPENLVEQVERVFSELTDGGSQRSPL